MLVEATLDFPEEEIDFLEHADARGRLAALGATLDAVLDRARQGVLLRDGISVVLAGQPNVGKSSLLNALAGAELAIVTPIPGTTRDKVAGTIQIEGVPVHVIDTAGLREGADASRAHRRRERSWDEIERADAVLFLHDLTRIGDPAYQAAEVEIAARLPAALVARGRLLHIDTKLDLVEAACAASAATEPAAPLDDRLAVSARTGAGLDALRRRLLVTAGWHAEPEGVFIARTRHLEALRRTREHLQLAGAHASAGDAVLELFAEELRLAHDALGEITGAFAPDDLLGVIFSRFCIGK